jgi:hypothetical protein
MRALLLISLVACAPKAPPASAPPQALASVGYVQELPVVAVGPATSAPYAGPALEGDRMALDLKSLARTQLDYTLHMETAGLATAAEGDVPLLLAHLAADPRWRVAEVDGVLAATRRSEADGGWTLPQHGYHRDDAGPWRVLLRFGAWPAEHPWVRSEFVAKASAATASATVRGFVPPNDVYHGNVTTALSVEGPRLSLDVYEMSAADDREHTRWALGEVPSLVYNVRTLRASIGATGHDAMLLPRGEPATAHASVALSAAGPGEVEFRGRINPGEPGWTWLRIVRDDRPFEELAVVAATRERAGWSPNPAHGFYLQSRIPVAPGPSFTARAELWFQADGGAPWRMHAEQVQVPAR